MDNKNEVVEFANKIGATDLKSKLDYSEFRGLFKRRNYFLLDGNKFLIIKIFRKETRPFWGFGKQFFDFFNLATEKNGTYYFVALVSNKSGWVLPKREIMGQISDGTLSYSDKQGEYKINNYNLKDHYSFSSTNDFLNKIK